MNQETMLKSTLFGGYRKKDVMEYVNSVLELHEQKVAELEQRIAVLTKLSKVTTVDTEKPSQEAGVTLPKDDAAVLVDETADNGEDSVTQPVIVSREAQIILERMNIPEGVYQVADDHSLISLSENQGSDDSKSGAKNDHAKNLQTGQLIHFAERRTLPQNSVDRHTERLAVPQPETLILDHTDRELNPTAKPSAEDVKPTIQPTYEDNTEGLTREQLKIQLDALIDITFQSELKLIQNELATVKEELKKVQKEKEALASKLEFSNELLLQLYKK